MSDEENVPVQSAGLTTASVAGTKAEPAPAPDPETTEAPAEAPAVEEPETEPSTDEDFKESGIKLDRTKGFGTVVSTEVVDGRKPRYLQDGEYFDSTGAHIAAMSGRHPEAKATTKPTAAPAPATQDAPAEPPATLAQQGEINLQDWIDGKAQYRWVEVRSAVNAAVGVYPKNKIEAEQLLQEHGIVNLDG